MIENVEIAGILFIVDKDQDEWSGQMLNPCEDYRLWCIEMYTAGEYRMLRSRGLIFGFIDLCSEDVLDPVITNVDGLTLVTCTIPPPRMIERLSADWKGQMMRFGLQEVSDAANQITNIAKEVAKEKVVPNLETAVESLAGAGDLS